MGKIYNLQKTKAYRSSLRSNLTPAEKILWFHIKNNQLGVKFRRQHGIGSYIVDFYCSKLNLVIEVDGHSHYTEQGVQYDLKRNQYLKKNGLNILRFTNQQVREELAAVIQQIHIYIQTKLRDQY
ncbi:endonuclease domain-containing protein [Vibrio sp. CK2-1]|uniref:endonuclease domain-containing protein n=1 Tax=Vibrio sp. CK2-1 TaxID=2912249 RepID=UPI001F1FC854|nr:endonuclease domain-containing protein [Vibrio sp. CK2-1]MCF7352832.1 endonuclease domain-containing protein [Vibrio sp. CK2-1]